MPPIADRHGPEWRTLHIAREEARGFAVPEFMGLVLRFGVQQCRMGELHEVLLDG